VKRLLWLAVSAVLVAGACSSSSDSRVIVAAGTTVVDSGFVHLLVDAYVRDGGKGQVDIVGLSSRQSLVYASAGNADVTITHDPAALNVWLEASPHAVSSPVFASRFVYVGSPDLSFRGGTVDEILVQVASEGVVFVSRDDGSGTHTKEVSLWEANGIDPVDEPWYVRTGSGMGETLLVTDQRGGVTLSEVGAYIAAADQISLVMIDAGTDAPLDNPYFVTVVSPAENEAAAEFGAWLLSEVGRSAIVEANDALFGFQVYRLP
jgi:tungstate transport system substrate-binding protein